MADKSALAWVSLDRASLCLGVLSVMAMVLTVSRLTVVRM